MKILSLREALRRGYSIEHPQVARKLGDTIQLWRPPRFRRMHGELYVREQSRVMITLQNETELALYNQKP